MSHRPRRARSVAVILALAAGLFGCAGEARETGIRSGGTEILWDDRGVPHIFAPSETDIFYAHGWATARSHGDRVLRLYGQSRGRAAEYWGAEHLESDRWVRTVGIPRRAADWYLEQTDAFRMQLDAFAAGINAYAEAHPEQIGDSVEVVLPVDGRDILAHLQRAILFTFVVSPDAVDATARRWRRAGSNAWAIAPSRSASGHAMLLANPHLPWSDLYLFYEAHLSGPGVNAYGANLVGLPGLGIAFNDRLGWTHTVNTHDGADLYELSLAEGGYRWDGEVRPFETEGQTLKVRQADGSIRAETLTVRRSVHGPVVAADGDRALALRMVGLDEPGMAEQWWQMARARNLDEFEEALRRMQMPMFTVLYADVEGNILHLFGGLTPVRPRGPWDWSGIVPGDTSATLWTETHPYADLPRVLNPASGWLQNANDPPWTTTFPRALSPDSFPAYLAPRFMHFRAQRSARMLRDDETITFQELIDYKHSTRMELADRILDDLLAAVREHGAGRAREAAEVLESWDRTADAGSRGGVLFEAFVYELMRRQGHDGFYAAAWDPGHPLATPDGFRDPAVAASALDAAAAQVEDRFGSLDVAWGEVHRLRRDGVDLPGNGGPGVLGIFRVVGYRDDDGRGRTAYGGDSYVAAIEFSDPPRARALIGYGNASQPGSPHRTDQLEPFARKELRPVWRTRAEIEDHLSERETVGGGER